MDFTFSWFKEQLYLKTNMCTCGKRAASMEAARGRFLMIFPLSRSFLSPFRECAYAVAEFSSSKLVHYPDSSAIALRYCPLRRLYGVIFALTSPVVRKLLSYHTHGSLGWGGRSHKVENKEGLSVRTGYCHSSRRHMLAMVCTLDTSSRERLNMFDCL